MLWDKVTPCTGVGLQVFSKYFLRTPTSDFLIFFLYFFFILFFFFFFPQADWFGSSKTYFILRIFGENTLIDLTRMLLFKFINLLPRKLLLNFLWRWGFWLRKLPTNIYSRTFYHYFCLLDIVWNFQPCLTQEITFLTDFRGLFVTQSKS